MTECYLFFEGKGGRGGDVFSIQPYSGGEGGRKGVGK